MVTPHTRTRWNLWLLLGLIILALIVVFARIWPLGADYLNAYHPVAEKWRKGEFVLYQSEEHVFYNMPWTLLPLLPLSYLPVEYGQSVVIVFSIVAILGTIHVFRLSHPVPAFIVFMALANLHTVDLLIRGQIDAILLVGAILGWWAIKQHRPVWLSLAFTLLITKPQNVTLVGLLFLIAMRDWPRADQIKSLYLVAGVLALSPLLAGLDWPIRYLDYVRHNPPADHRSISVWRNAPLIGLPIWPMIPIVLIAVIAFLRAAWRDGLTGWTFCLALTTNVAFGFYVNGYHYVLLVPAFIFIASKYKLVALLAYLATWTPLIRLHDNTLMYPDMLYPVILLSALWYFGLKYPAPSIQAESASADAANAADHDSAARPDAARPSPGTHAAHLRDAPTPHD